MLQFFLLFVVNIIVANRPYLGGTVPIFYAKFPTVPIFLDCVPIFLNRRVAVHRKY